MSEIISLWINKAVTCTVIGRENELSNLSTYYSLNSEGDLWILHLPDSWMVTLVVGLVERGYISYRWRYIFLLDMSKGKWHKLFPNGVNISVLFSLNFDK